MITIVNFFALLTLSVAIPQYPPSGWRPKGTPFVLPLEYLPSAPLKAAAKHEINRERLEYIGQYQIREPIFGHRANIQQPESQLQNEFQTQSQQSQIQQTQQSQQPQQPQYQPPPQPHTTYLTPSPEIPTTTEQYVDDFTTTTEYSITTTTVPVTENFLRVQGLPSLDKPAQFRNPNKKVTPLNTNTFSQQQNSNLKSGQFRQQQFQSERSNAQQARQQQGLKEQVALVNTETGKTGKQVVSPVSNTYGPPELGTPANAYGVPHISKQPDNKVLNSKLPKDENSSDSNESTEDSTEQQREDNEQGNVAISNAINANGQYYILSPDNMLQRVLFMTTPNEGDTGFTAQLRYMPVEPIRDPIYAYNENGQLVRIFRK